MLEHLRSLRDTIKFLIDEKECVVVDAEVDPHLEVAGIQKALDESYAVLFEHVKGYPNARMAINVFASNERIAKIFGVKDRKELKLKIKEAFKKPLPPVVVDKAPVHEVVITKDINVWDVIPMISHTEKDPGRTLGGGISFVSGKYFAGGTHIGFNRMSFLPDRRDYSSFQISPGSHMWMVASEFYRKEPIPLTMNIGVPPAVYLVAGSGFNYVTLPKGCDEVGLAGAIQGEPIEIVKAKTVDAYAIANAEFTIEGYLDTTQRVWETPEAERAQRQGVYPFHPEWSGYMGRAYRTYKFQVTAITYRKDRPIYYNPIVHGHDDHNIDSIVREASLMDLADRIQPGIVIDVHIPLGMTDWGGAIFQVRKRSIMDEGYQVNILHAALAVSRGMRLAIAVDEDVNIYSAEDVLWALTTRTSPERISVVAPGGVGQAFMPAERVAAAETPAGREVTHRVKFEGGIAIDATVPFEFKEFFERPTYPKVNLEKFFTKEFIEKARARQSEYTRYLAERRL
jgi:4-hydroxy-3-polyprenylbenzoate decarboxylase